MNDSDRLASKTQTASKQCNYLIGSRWIYNSINHLIDIDTNKTFTIRAKTADVLNLLIKHRKCIVSSEEFLNNLWDGRFVSENVLKQSVSELRSVFKDSNKSIIKTAPKKGYSLNIDIRILEPDEIATITQFPSDNTIAYFNPELIEGKTKTPRIKAKAPNCKNHAAPTSTSITTPHIPLAQESPASQIGAKLVLVDFIKKKWQKKSHYLNILTLSVFSLSLLLYTVFTIYLPLQSIQKTQDITINELQTTIDYLQQYLSNYHYITQNSAEDLQRALGTSQEISTNSPISLVERQGMLRAMTSLYSIGGFDAKSRVLLGRMSENAERLYGKHSAQAIELKMQTISALISLNQRQDAYDLSRYILDTVTSYHKQDSDFLAKAYTFAAKAYLYCTEPFCKRERILESGEQYVKKALDLLDEKANVDVADALCLLNWFIWDKNEKVSLLKKALTIYNSELGHYNEKTASTSEQLGRTYTFFFKQWEVGEKYLLESLQIKKKLYANDNAKMARIWGYLGEHYFMVADYPKAKNYILLYLEATKKTRGRLNDGYLEKLLFLTRVELYNGNLNSSQLVLNEALELIGKKQYTPPSILLQAIHVTQLRIATESGIYKSDYQELKKLTDTALDTYKSPSAILKHEYLTQIFINHPDKIHNEYLNSLLDVQKHLKPSSRYLYDVDLTYLKKRAHSICSKIPHKQCKDINLSVKQISSL